MIRKIEPKVLWPSPILACKPSVQYQRSIYRHISTNPCHRKCIFRPMGSSIQFFHMKKSLSASGEHIFHKPNPFGHLHNNTDAETCYFTGKYKQMGGLGHRRSHRTALSPLLSHQTKIVPGVCFSFHGRTNNLKCDRLRCISRSVPHRSYNLLYSHTSC